MISIASFLKSVPGFSQVDPADLEAISQNLSFVTFRSGTKLMARGEAGTSMYVIQDGPVRIPIVDKEEGGIRNEIYLGPGDMVGEMAILTGEPRSADVYAAGEVRAVEIDRSTVLPLLEANPPLARILTEILGTRLESGGGIERVGKYRLLGKLGQGSTSRVYQALHPDLNRIVAVKMLSHALVYDTTFKERFIDEARTIAGLSHPNLVQIYDTESAYMTYFIVMEKVSGTDLARILRRRKKLTPSQAMKILSQVADALQYAHGEGIAHRDVKPANCMLAESGRVKLMDFGIAQRVESNPSRERAKVVEGTPRYLAPEAAVGRPVDGRADIYALGIMAYEMVTGQVPFHSPNIRDLLKMHVREEATDVLELEPDLPEGLVEFIRGAMKKRPDERLTDWTVIRALLSPEGTVPTIRTVTTQPRVEHTEHIQVRFNNERKAEVYDAIEAFVSELATKSGIQVATGRMTPVRPTSPLDDTHIEDIDEVDEVEES